jgi:hypothetical protein
MFVSGTAQSRLSSTPSFLPPRDPYHSNLAIITTPPADITRHPCSYHDWNIHSWHFQIGQIGRDLGVRVIARVQGIFKVDLAFGNRNQKLHTKRPNPAHESGVLPTLAPINGDFSASTPASPEVGFHFPANPAVHVSSLRTTEPSSFRMREKTL